MKVSVGGSHPLVDALRAAEADADAARRAFVELIQLPPLPRRRLLSCWLQEVPSVAERARRGPSKPRADLPLRV